MDSGAGVWRVGVASHSRWPLAARPSHRQRLFRYDERRMNFVPGNPVFTVA